MPPPLGRVTLRSISVNVHCLPLRWSSTVRLPSCRPISVRSRPSKPPASRLSIQASSAARSGTPLRAVEPAPAAAAGGVAGAAEAAAAGRSTFAGGDACAGMAGGSMAEAVTNGRLLLPAKTVTLLSDSMRTAISAPTKLSRSARMRPASRPAPEMPTSALGALATMVPSASRTTMSRMRSDVRRLLASRSIWVPPISTSWPGPKFSLIAAVSHGVAISSSIGPLDRRHQSANSARKTRPPSVPPTMANLRSCGHHARTNLRSRIHPSPRRDLEGSGEHARTRRTASPSCGDASCPHKCSLRLASSFRRASRVG